jgi:hypothetical protein
MGSKGTCYHSDQREARAEREEKALHIFFSYNLA